MFLDTLDNAAATGLPLVVNYITGFPGEAPDEAARWLQWVEREIALRRPALVAKVEHNTFQMERLAPLARDPRIDITRTWPWATVLGWWWKGAWRTRERHTREAREAPSVGA